MPFPNAVELQQWLLYMSGNINPSTTTAAAVDHPLSGCLEIFAGCKHVGMPKGDGSGHQC